MRVARQRSWLASLVRLVVLSVVSAAGLQAQSGTVTGRVTAEDTKGPLGDAQVLVVGTSTYTVTNADGRFTLRNVSSGMHTFRVIRVGYAEQKKTSNVPPSQTVTLDFEMPVTVVRLQEVVTTATGEQRRVELGHSVATVDVSKKLQDAPIKNFGDLLVAKAPGVQVLPANMTGGGSRVRIRGTGSFNLNNDPIYIIDGIRMTSTSAGGPGTGGTGPSRVNDLNPEEIENIEIVKGPSAATLYGTDAANGVIVITTKRGRAGRTNWNVFADHGQIQDRNDYPTQYAILGHSPNSTTSRKCLLKELAQNFNTTTGVGCIMDSTTSLNVYKDQDITPIKLGQRDNFGVQATGGTEAVRFFLSADAWKETGPFGLPAFSERRFDSLKTTIYDHMRRPSQLEQASARANLNASISPTLDIAVTTNFIRLDQRFPQVDNNVNSMWYNGMMGPGWKGAGPGYTGIGSLGQPLQGYLNFTPGEIYQRLANQNVHRTIFGTNINWRPYRWLASRADLGVDLTNRVDVGLNRFGEYADFGTQRLGVSSDSRGSVRNMTGNLNGTATFSPRPWVNLKTTLGVQYVNFNNFNNSASGSILPPGGQTPGQGTTQSAGQSTSLSNTLGMFVEQTAAINDRLFLTAAVRTDQNSAFGANLQRVIYPKAQVSWIVSDEDFFPRFSWLSEMRLRTSVGSAGQQPGANDALRTFSTTTTSILGADVSGLRSSALGNPDLLPERQTEFEAGVDFRMFSNRVNVEATYYNKKSQDALVNQAIAPGAGTSAGSVLRNLGGTQNTGFELLVNTQLLDSRSVGWDLTVSASKNANKINSLGVDAAGNPIPTISPQGTTQERNGYPVHGYWGRRFTYEDKNGDGIIVPGATQGELTVDPTFTFIGYSSPRDEISITNGLELLNRQLRITALFDFKAGSNVFNNEEGFLCQQSSSCPYTSTLNPSLYNQARTVALRDQGTLNTNVGFLEPLQFWRFREISASYTFSDRTARIIRASGANVTASMRNVHIWTNYTGVDPEANYGQGDTQQTLLTAGPPTYFQLRLNLRY